VNALERPAICLVTDRRRLCPGASASDSISALEDLLGLAIDAGVDVVQIRERDLDAGILSALVRRVVGRARGRGVRVLVNDRADVALAAGADGVHLRADSPDVDRVRPLAPQWLVGRSIHAGAPPVTDADYLLFGTVFPTPSKPGVDASGVAALAGLAASSSTPVFAIGGITPGNARECWRAGAAGIAAIGAFLPEGCAPGAIGVAAAVRAFRAALA
jgi:thiamine-phosphate pyrophosphorylase